MGFIMGIDIGGSTTKIVGFYGGELIGTLKVRASDPQTSAYGAFGKFLSVYGLSIADVERIAFTGVGASFLKGEFYSLPATRVGEFQAIGLGGSYLSGLRKAVVVSMGTGTAFVRVNGDEVIHLGGSGVGGGTIQGLAERMLGLRKFESIVALAEQGNAGKVDLTVGDISMDKLPNMPMDTTASNFGGLSDEAHDADVASGILNLIFQTIGMLSVFAAKEEQIRDVVLTGNLTQVKYGRKVFEMLENLHGVRFIIPDHAEYATAIGAAFV